jgi:hypothetical protein
MEHSCNGETKCDNTVTKLHLAAGFKSDVSPAVLAQVEFFLCSLWSSTVNFANNVIRNARLNVFLSCKRNRAPESGKRVSFAVVFYIQYHMFFGR